MQRNLEDLILQSCEPQRRNEGESQEIGAVPPLPEGGTHMVDAVPPPPPLADGSVGDAHGQHDLAIVPAAVEASMVVANE